MDIRLNGDGVLNLVCAAFLVGALGFSAVGASTSGCAAPRLERGEPVADSGDQHPCDVAETRIVGRGRPGMRMLPNQV